MVLMEKTNVMVLTVRKVSIMLIEKMHLRVLMENTGRVVLKVTTNMMVLIVNQHYYNGKRQYKFSANCKNVC